MGLAGNEDTELEGRCPGWWEIRIREASRSLAMQSHLNLQADNKAGKCSSPILPRNSYPGCSHDPKGSASWVVKQSRGRLMHDLLSQRLPMTVKFGGEIWKSEWRNSTGRQEKQWVYDQRAWVPVLPQAPAGWKSLEKLTSPAQWVFSSV